MILFSGNTERGQCFSPFASCCWKRHDDLDVDHIYVYGLNVTDGKFAVGNGGAVFRAVLEMARQNGLPVYLTPAASLPMTQVALVAWYKRLGFVWEEDFMVLFPASSTGGSRADVCAPDTGADAVRENGQIVAAYC